ncbi:hypothetical protein K1719_044701 [Acacia pycnantha]|nr:hypothetical protein K1719_044701 [Acacia pycnantha]
MERTLVIKLLGRSVTYFDHLNRTRTLWRLKGSFQLIDGEGGFFFATFDLEEDYTKVLIGGPWMIFGAYLIVQPWTIAFDPRTAKLSNVVVQLRISVCLSATITKARREQLVDRWERNPWCRGSRWMGGRMVLSMKDYHLFALSVEGAKSGGWGRNNGNKIGSGNGNGIGKNPADLMGKESMSKPTIRRPNPSHSTSKVMVNEYRKKHNHDGPPSTQPVSSSAINSSSSSPTLEPGNITMERSPMEAPLVLSPEQTGIEKTKNNVTPPAIPNQDRPALTDVEPTRSDSFGDQQRIKKRVGVSQKGKENINMELLPPIKGQHGVNLRSSSAKSLKVRKKPSSPHMSKDAIAVLKEELVTPRELVSDPGCSSGETLPVHSQDEDPTGSGVRV